MSIIGFSNEPLTSDFRPFDKNKFIKLNERIKELERIVEYLEYRIEKLENH